MCVSAKGFCSPHYGIRCSSTVGAWTDHALLLFMLFMLYMLSAIGVRCGIKRHIDARPQANTLLNDNC